MDNRCYTTEEFRFVCVCFTKSSFEKLSFRFRKFVFGVTTKKAESIPTKWKEYCSIQKSTRKVHTSHNIKVFVCEVT